jgi:hypothetical protein
VLAGCGRLGFDPLSGASHDSSDAAPVDALLAEVTLSGAVAGDYTYMDTIVTIQDVTVQPWNGADLATCDVGEAGCFSVHATEIRVVGIIDGVGAGYGGGGGGGGGPSYCNAMNCSPTGTMGPVAAGGAGVRGGTAGGTATGINNAGSGGKGGGLAGGVGGGGGGWGGCGGASGPGAPGGNGGYAVAGANGDTSTDLSILAGSGGGGGGGGVSNECFGPAGWAGGGGAGNPGGAYVRLDATAWIVIDASGMIHTGGRAASTGNGSAGINPTCNGNISSSRSGGGGAANVAGTSSSAGNGGMACASTAASSGGRGGTGAGGGVVLRAPVVELDGTLDLFGAGVVGGTLKVFGALAGTPAGFGRACVGPVDGPCS